MGHGLRNNHHLERYHKQKSPYFYIVLPFFSYPRAQLHNVDPVGEVYQNASFLTKLQPSEALPNAHQELEKITPNCSCKRAGHKQMGSTLGILKA